MSRTAKVGALVAAVLWCGVWVAVFFVAGDTVARVSGATGTAESILRVGLPALLSMGWVALLIRAARNHARRRRLLRQEFIEPPPPPASRAGGA